MLSDYKQVRKKTVLHAAVFEISGKNRWVGRICPPPLSSARVKLVLGNVIRYDEAGCKSNYAYMTVLGLFLTQINNPNLVRSLEKTTKKL